MRTRAEFLRELVAEREDRSQIDALQSFTICVGDRLGLDEEELWNWRSAIVWWMTGRPEELKQYVDLINERALYAQVAECAGAWLGDAGPSLEVAGSPEVLAAWKYAATVIVPQRG